MFGAEKRKEKEDRKNELFDLGKDLKNPSKQKARVAHVEEQMQKVKKMLREGLSDKDFTELGFLLHGYASLLKILSDD